MLTWLKYTKNVYIHPGGHMGHPDTFLQSCLKDIKTNNVNTNLGEEFDFANKVTIFDQEYHT